MTLTTIDILWLAIGAFTTLVGLTFLGEVLRARQDTKTTNPVLETYMARVQSWWAMVAFIGIAMLTGKVGVTILFAFASFAALREFLTLTTKAQADHMSLALVFFVVLSLQYIFVALELTGLYAVFIPVYVFLMLPIVSAMRGDANRFLIRVAETQWGLMIAVYCVSYVLSLMNLDIAGYGDRAILLVTFLVSIPCSKLPSYRREYFSTKDLLCSYAPKMNRRRVKVHLGGIRTCNILPANIAFFTIDIISFGRQNIGTRFCKATSNCGSVTSAARSALKTVLISSMAFYRAITSTCSCPSPRNWLSAT